MKVKAVLVLVVALFVLGSVTSGDVWAQKKPMVLRLVSAVPGTEYPLGVMLQEFAKRFNARAKGEYEIQVSSGGTLAKLPEFLDAVKFGTVEMASFPWSPFQNLDPRFGATDTPFLYNTYEAGVAAADALFPLHDQILQERFNAKNLQFFNAGGFHVLARKPIKTLEDLKGLLIGTPSPSGATLIKDLGAAPVVIMWTDLYESFQKKVIDATTQQYHGMILTNTADIAKYMTYVWMFSGYYGLSINLDIWKKMPPDIQKALQEEAKVGQDWAHKVQVKQFDDDMKAVKAKGVSMYVLPKAERDRWVRATLETREKKFAKLGDFGVKVLKICEEADKKFPYKEPKL